MSSSGLQWCVCGRSGWHTHHCCCGPVMVRVVLACVMSRNPHASGAAEAGRSLLASHGLGPASCIADSKGVGVPAPHPPPFLMSLCRERPCIDRRAFDPLTDPVYPLHTLALFSAFHTCAHSMTDDCGIHLCMPPTQCKQSAHAPAAHAPDRTPASTMAAAYLTRSA